jgi:hypothetical protein
MQRAILIVLLLGLIASAVSAQPAEESAPPRGYGEYADSPYETGMRRVYSRARRVDPRQTQKLIEAWKKSKEAAEREKFETELRALLRQEFAARLAEHEREIKQLEEKVRQLRERLALRKEKQEDIVDHRLQQILREAQGLGWGSERAGGESIFHYRQTTSATQGTASDILAPDATNPLNAAEPADDLFGDPVPAPGNNSP